MKRPIFDIARTAVCLHGHEPFRFCRPTFAIAFRQIEQFIADEGAATAIEYALVASGVGLCVASSVWKLGSTIKVTFYDKLASMFP